MPFSAHASACAILAFADGGSRNSLLHPPQEALGISTLAQGSQDSRSVLLAEHREPRRLPPQATEFAKVCTAVKPAEACCPHPSRRFNPLYAVPPPSSEGGEGAPAPRTDFFSALPSAGRYLPLFFCNQKKSRKTVKEKFLQPPPSRSRVRLPLEKGE